MDIPAAAPSDVEPREQLHRRVLVISGSVRPGRIGPTIAKWVCTELTAQLQTDPSSTSPSVVYTVVDLAEWPLALDDEPAIPALITDGLYACATTRAWSQLVMAADGFVFVTPQYNWSIPASLKNALDHLYVEWINKPAAIISYGYRGGGKSAQSLQQVLAGLHMRVAAVMPAVKITTDRETMATTFERTEASNIRAAGEQLVQLLLVQ